MDTLKLRLRRLDRKTDRPADAGTTTTSRIGDMVNVPGEQRNRADKNAGAT